MKKDDFDNEILKFVTTDFLLRYVSNEQRRDLIMQELKTILSKDILHKLIKRVAKGNKHDIIQFIETTFASLPYGLRSHLVTDLSVLYKKFKSISTPIMSVGSCLDSFNTNTISQNLILSWRSGRITPMQFYRQLSDLLQKGDITMINAEDILSTILQEGGWPLHMSAADFDNTRRIRFDTYYFDIAALSHSHVSRLDGMELTLLSESGGLLALGRHNAPQVVLEEDISYQALSKLLKAPSSGTDLYWYHVTGGDQLILLPAGTINSDNKPVLIIGDMISIPSRTISVTQYGRLDLDRVIAVDTSTADSEDDLICLCILVEGRYISTTSLDASHRGFTDCDGRSEISAGVPDIEEIASDSGGEEHDVNRRKEPAVSTLKRRYYLLFAVAYRGDITIEHVSSLHDGLVIDQRPLDLLYQKRDMAVVYGTNGQLGVVYATTTALTSTKQDDIPCKYISLTCDFESPLFRKAHCARYPFLASNATTTTYDASTRVHSVAQFGHAPDAVITAISFRPKVGILASGDDQGCVCLWNINDQGVDKHPFQYLLATPLVLGLESIPLKGLSLNHNAHYTQVVSVTTPAASPTSSQESHEPQPAKCRIASLHLSDSGHMVTCGIFDRLIAIGVSFQKPLRSHLALTGDSKSTSPSATQDTDSCDDEYTPLCKLYVKASLDIVPGCRAHYQTHFASDSLLIWRIMTAPSTAQTNTLTHTKRDAVAIDKLQHQLGIEESYRGSGVGITVTSWLHPNMDAFEKRQSSPSTYPSSASLHGPTQHSEPPVSALKLISDTDTSNSREQVGGAPVARRKSLDLGYHFRKFTLFGSSESADRSPSKENASEGRTGRSPALARQLKDTGDYLTTLSQVHIQDDSHETKSMTSSDQAYRLSQAPSSHTPQILTTRNQELFPYDAPQSTRNDNGDWTVASHDRSRTSTLESSYSLTGLRGPDLTASFAQDQHPSGVLSGSGIHAPIMVRMFNTSVSTGGGRPHSLSSQRTRAFSTQSEMPFAGPGDGHYFTGMNLIEEATEEEDDAMGEIVNERLFPSVYEGSAQSSASASSSLSQPVPLVRRRLNEASDDAATAELPIAQNLPSHSDDTADDIDRTNGRLVELHRDLIITSYRREMIKLFKHGLSESYRAAYLILATVLACMVHVYVYVISYTSAHMSAT